MGAEDRFVELLRASLRSDESLLLGPGDDAAVIDRAAGPLVASTDTLVEGVDFLPGLAGESRDLDANSPYIRVFGNGGTLTYSLQPGLFGQALQPFAGVQPQVPAPHLSGDGARVKVTRPPLKENVPCETQKAITQKELNNAPTGTGPKQIHTTLSPLGRKAEALIEPLAMKQLASMARSEGLKVSPSVKLP